MDLSPILARTEAVTRRIRLARALRTGATMGSAGLAGIAVAVAAHQVGVLSATDLAVAIGVGAGLPLIAGTAAALRSLPRLLPAELLDRTFGLGGRLTTAIELAAAPVPPPLAALAIEDALARVNTVVPARAFPIHVPQHARALVIAAAAVLVASTLQRPAPAEPPPSLPPHLAALLVHRDDLALERDALHDLEQQSDPTPELHRAIDETNALLEALEDRSVDRREALRRLGELAEALDRPRPTSLVAREERLEAIGDRLGRGETTSDLAQALRDSDAAEAQRALSALADRLREHSLSADERRRLREALAEAREAESDESLDQEIQQAQEALEQQQAQRQSEEQERLLQQRQEEVQRLREQHQQRMEAERELERLERELGEAADQMNDSEEGDEQAAQSLDDAAEELNRTARDQASEQQMQQLAEQLRQLREMIRRQREQQQGGSGDDGEGGEGSSQGSQSGQGSRMDRYVLRASGGEGGTEGTRVGVRSGGGSSGEGEGETEGSQGETSEQEQGTPGATSGSGQGEEGQGEGGEGQGDEGREQQMLVLGDESGGEGSAILELPGFGRSGSGTRQGAGGEGEGDNPGGAGNSHEPGSLADPTDRNGDHRTVAVHGEDRGRGPSRSEVIRGGAASGFASRDYERVYAEYEAHAERAIEEDEIPPGYRFYVRRYFDLIRPRD